MYYTKRQYQINWLSSSMVATNKITHPVFLYCFFLSLMYPLLPVSLDYRFCFCIIFLSLMYPMLPVSLDCSFCFCIAFLSLMYRLLPVSLDYRFCFCIIFLSVMYPMLPVSLDCPFWLSPLYSLTFIYYITNDAILKFL